MYVAVCAVAAVWAGYERVLGFGFSFIFCLVLTPVLGIPISLLFKKLPVACCMHDYRDFSTGTCYHFRKKYRNGQWFYFVQHASTHTFSDVVFNKHFSIVVKDREHIYDAIEKVK